MKWLNRKNETFSLLSGENFTNKEVVLAHVGVVVFIFMCSVAEWWKSHTNLTHPVKVF